MFEYDGNYGYNNSKEMHVEIKYKRGNEKNIYIYISNKYKVRFHHPDIYIGCIIAGCGKLNLHRALAGRYYSMTIRYACRKIKCTSNFIFPACDIQIKLNRKQYACREICMRYIIGENSWSSLRKLKLCI